MSGPDFSSTELPLALTLALTGQTLGKTSMELSLKATFNCRHDFVKDGPRKHSAANVAQKLAPIRLAENVVKALWLPGE